MRITLACALALALSAALAAPALAQEGAGDTATKTAEHPAAVEIMLSNLQSNLYQPEQDGLRTLSFELRVEDPAIGHVATASATWVAGQPADVKVEMHDFEIPAAIAAMAGGDEAQLAQMKEMIRSVLPGQINSQMQGILDNVLNRSVQTVREDYVGSMDGVTEDGFVKLRFKKRSGAAADVDEQVFHVDEDSVIRRVETSQDMGMGPQPMTVEMNWVDAGGDNTGLVLDSRVTKLMVPSPLGEMQQTIRESFSYTDIDGIKILSSVTSSMMGQSQTQTLDKLVVNGKAVASGGRSAEG